MILGAFESYYLGLPTIKFSERKTGSNWFKPVFHRSSQILNWERPQTGPRSRSTSVLLIYGLDQLHTGKFMFSTQPKTILILFISVEN